MFRGLLRSVDHSHSYISLLPAHGKAPLPKAFSAIGWDFARYVIAVGSSAGLSTSLLCAMFPMPRVIYAMADDGLLFSFLAVIPERFKTPIAATLISGFLAAGMTLIFDVSELVEMMSIGTLLAYTLVAASVLILRMRGDADSPKVDASGDPSPSPSVNASTETENALLVADEVNPKNLFSKVYGGHATSPTPFTESVSLKSVASLGVGAAAFSLFLLFASNDVVEYRWWAILLLVFFIIVILLAVITLWRQPQNNAKVMFKVPLVPLLPAASMFINIYLMSRLKSLTWIRFGVWMAIGFLIYFGYGVFHSKQRYAVEQEESSSEDSIQLDSNSLPSPTSHN